MGALCDTAVAARPAARPQGPRGLSWTVVERVASPAELVGELPEPRGGRLACICVPTSAALVLGSSQRLESVDVDRLEAAHLSLERRRSGGGAVLVAPGQQVWLDAFLPRGDPLLEEDLARSSWWLGELWAQALVASGADHATLAVHRGAIVHSPWSRSLCFAGLGPGEVTLSGRKLVGISQRRGRLGAWFHSTAPVGFDPDLLAGLVPLDALARRALAGHLAGQVATLPVVAKDLEERLRRTLGGGDVGRVTHAATA